MAHGDAREGKWRGNWQMEWVASTLHTTSDYVVSSITTADAHTLAACSRLNWRPRRFKWTRPFRRKTKSGFYACAITFHLASTCLETSVLAKHFIFRQEVALAVGLRCNRSFVWDAEWTLGRSPIPQYEEVEIAVCEWLRMQEPDLNRKGIFKLGPRCITILGD
jgi:hypothetical protein